MNAMNGVVAEATGTVAVLVDGENVAVRHGAEILAGAARLGAVRIRRVYGNAALLPGWDAAPGFDLIHTGSGKNSADMKLAIDAVDMAARGMARHFLIVSSDADFTHLARYLRETGFGVTGMGEAKTAEGFQRACGVFVRLGPPANSVKPPVGLGELPLHRAVAEILHRECGGEGVEIGMLNALVRRHLDVRIGTRPEKTWNAFLAKHTDLFHCNGEGASRRVNLRTNV